MAPGIVAPVQKENPAEQYPKRRADACVIWIVGTNDHLPLHEGVERSTRLGTTVSEFSRLMRYEDDFVNIVKYIGVLGIPKRHMRGGWKDMRIDVMSFKIESVDNVECDKSDMDSVTP